MHHEFEVGAIDNSVESINEVLILDLVGDLGNERKVAKLIEKTPEAKSRNHVIGCYRRLSEIVSEKAVNSLLKPLKDHLLVSVDKRLHLQVDKGGIKIAFPVGLIILLITPVKAIRSA